METNLPCINARGVVDLGYAIAYPSHEGLVLVTAGGQAALATEQLFNRTGWQLLNPGTLCAGQLSGRYIASYNSQDADGKPLIGTIIIASSAPTFLSRSDVRARVFYYDVSEGALYFLNDAGDIMRLDPPAGATLNLYWRSKPLLLTSPENFGVIQIDGDPVPTAAEVRNINEARAAANAANVALLTGPLGSELNGTYLNHYRLAGDGLVVLPSVAKKVTVSVYADRKLVAAVSTFGGMVRLPSGFRARTWEIDVFGTVRVQQIALAATATELRQVAAS
jgi:hypothetical protein